MAELSLKERLQPSLLDRLTDQERVIFELHYLDGATQARTADLLGLSLGTVNSRLQSIRGKYTEIRLRVAQEAA